LVRIGYVAATNRATNALVAIEHADGRAESRINQRLPPTDGHFTALGAFRFSAARPAAVTIFNTAADGFVGVDAVQLLPQP